jgi:hypothetical protein
MATDLRTIASQYLTARREHQKAKHEALAAELQLHEIEKELTDAFQNAPGEDGTCFVVDGKVILLPEEWWEAAPGQRVEVHLIVGS